MKGNKTAALLLLAACLAFPAAAHEVTGQVRVNGRTDAGVPTIVYAERLDAPEKPRARKARLTQRNKSFEPRVIAVPAGSSIEFPNEDPIYHNVFSLTPSKPFDLGLYKAGASKSQSFKLPATYRVFCNIHPQMTAVLLVLPTDRITEAAADGRFSLDVPPGRYRVTAWSERAKPASLEVTVPGAAVTLPDLTLDESQFVELPHKNKYGQDYAQTPPAPPAKPN